MVAIKSCYQKQKHAHFSYSVLNPQHATNRASSSLLFCLCFPNLLLTVKYYLSFIFFMLCDYKAVDCAILPTFSQRHSSHACCWIVCVFICVSHTADMILQNVGKTPLHFVNFEMILTGINASNLLVKPDSKNNHKMTLQPWNLILFLHHSTSQSVTEALTFILKSCSLTHMVQRKRLVQLMCHRHVVYEVKSRCRSSSGMVKYIIKT